MTRHTTAKISLEALTQNIAAIKSLLRPKTKFMAVIKANAYGHGAVAIAKYLEEENKVDYFAVACIYEVVQLRQNGIKTPILNFGALDKEDLRYVFEYDFTPTIFSYETALELSEMAVSLGKEIKIHIKINTGMNRLGVDYQDAVALIKKIHNLPSLEIEGIYSHLACAEKASHKANKLQIARFEEVIQELKKVQINPPLKHIANSAGAIFLPNSHFDMVRIGIALYGYLSVKKLRLPIILEPILELKTQITQIREVKKGEGVSYGWNFIAKRPTKIATLAIGYGDGLARILQKKLKLIVRGKLVKITGRICMDQLMVDVSAIKNLEVGDEVVIIGKVGKNEITARDLAVKLKTIPYEVLTGLGARVERVYKK